MLDHAACAHGQGDGHHRRQGLGYGRHRQAHGGEEHQRQVLAADDAGDEQDGRDPQHRPRQALAEMGQPLLQRGLAIALPGQQPGDAAQFGVAAGGHHQSLTAAMHHHRPPVGHVQSLCEHGLDS